MSEMTGEDILALALEGCGYCGHVSAEDIARVEGNVEKILFAEYSDGWGPEHSADVLVKLKDGSYAVVTEAEDTSGHGCLCSADIGFYKTEDEALRLGLQQENRDRIAAGETLVYHAW